MILFPSGLTQSRMFSTQDSFIFSKRKSTENLIVLRISSVIGYKEEYDKDSESIIKYYIQRINNVSKLAVLLTVRSKSVVAHLCRVQLFATPRMRLLYPWDSPGKNIGVGCHSLFQGIFPTQRLKLGLPHCRRILYHHQGK